ncbi:IclR family transcriptional regulator [Nocardia jinanensis]|uniref:IclR family transcriptional regulator n=1 Tax=Nocardia jinanensis TaxID=382504 RepID=A0A917VMH6_9NOCA|nr:IclR family transcriptional regulator [Nocardia jinanensis]GGK98982.1 IclR family transcriptional regulator [Nocardia jinanensis]
MTQQDQATGRSGSSSSRKLLRILLAFSETRHTRSVADLAAELGLPVSSVYRYLSALRDNELVEEDGRGGYRLSWTAVGMGRAARAARGSLPETTRPVMEAVCDLSGETTLLVARVNHHVLCLDRAESTHPVRLQFEPGVLMSLHRGSAARVLLASMPPRERRAFLATQQLPEAEREQIEADIATVAGLGWVQSFGEVDEGIWGVSAAIRDDGRVVGALGLAGPLYRLDKRARERIISLVVSGAELVSDALAQGVAVDLGDIAALSAEA